MPTYEYACTKCGQHVEVFQRLSEAPLATCGACGGPLRKVFHPAGIVFRGSGFYATDSRAKPKTDASKGSTDPAASNGSKDRSSGSPESPGSSSASSSGEGSAPATTGGGTSS